LGGAVALLAHPDNADYFGMLGYLFTWKFALLVLFIVAMIFIYRFFCRFFCPLGAIYGFFCKVSMLGIKFDKSKCVDCGKCIQTCKMDIKHVGDHECINCGECIPVCPTKAISWKGSKIFVKSTTPVSLPEPQTDSVNLMAYVTPVSESKEDSEEAESAANKSEEVKDEREI
jgi:polyferredoxin